MCLPVHTVPVHTAYLRWDSNTETGIASLASQIIRITRFKTTTNQTAQLARTPK